MANCGGTTGLTRISHGSGINFIYLFSSLDKVHVWHTVGVQQG